MRPDLQIQDLLLIKYVKRVFRYDCAGGKTEMNKSLFCVPLCMLGRLSYAEVQMGLSDR